MAQPGLLQLFWAAGGPAWSWQSYAADPRELGTPWGLGQLAGLLKTQEALPQGSPTQKDCLRIWQIFSQSG